jgi:hypothetical protein
MANQDVNPASEASLIRYQPSPVLREEHAEGRITRLIEQQTAKIPSDVFLVAALAAMGTSLVLEVASRRRLSRFIGMWPAPLLVMGVYNKLVKLLHPG